MANQSAGAIDSRLLLNGTHTLTTLVIRFNATIERETVSFSVQNAAPTVAQTIQVSASGTRSNPAQLSGQTLAGSVAIFVAPSTLVRKVDFWLDKNNLLGSPRSTDSLAPLDFNGTAGSGQANLFNVGSLAAGPHRVAVRVTYTNGTTAILSGNFVK